ncbi:rhodanese-related sulfurtransferase [Hoyosella sp. YIM 151337]|uniref:oxygen-dependent tRNA uridine(34) hydroxylase TrhO n=1 Tax=Hoyosella sp. YIM 151337 TaxID=2992742 RepID=UPI002235EAA7|nr:rhodanese-related sulfurtransferase [Hoyosella sp. YIM 151337]MCW4352327.1 rhodanese-related sulfurtransferase [Hoyosella sp. YIM 151337]
MSIPKVVLFYVFTPLPDPEAIRLWQRTLCEANDLKGRIIISAHGINVTVGGELAQVKRYVRETRSYAPFREADIKWSDGAGDDFPRLSVKVRPEIVTFGAPDEIKVDENGVIGGGTHLSPEQVHNLVDERGDEVVFFDGRNALEAAVGRFRDAVVTDAAATRDFLSEIESGKYDHLKDKPVVTYCTGGVRCEVLSVLMRNRGFNEVYQIDGGIVRYGEKYRDDGLWEGALYVFDSRMTTTFSPAAKTLGQCTLCGAATSRFENYPDALGRDLTLVCEGCSHTTSDAG